MRVWVPDRPGALGAVASRIGAVRGDLVGIDILERGGGKAIDELVIELPDAGLVPLLLAEVGEVDGADVEDIRPVAIEGADERLEALETAVALVDQTTQRDLLEVLVSHVRDDLEAEWSVVLNRDPPTILVASGGDAPDTSWLAAFVEGGSLSGLVASGETGPGDLAWAALPSAGLALVLGRTGRPFRARERRQLAALAGIADCRSREVG
jgi:hypothetical protein